MACANLRELTLGRIYRRSYLRPDKVVRAELVTATRKLVGTDNGQNPEDVTDVVAQRSMDLQRHVQYTSIWRDRTRP